jgi:hypothetical protein
MPFSTLSDPSDLARAYAALEAVWNEVKGLVPAEVHEMERVKIAYLVSHLAPTALDEEDLKQKALLHYMHAAPSGISTYPS